MYLMQRLAPGHYPRGLRCHTVMHQEFHSLALRLTKRYAQCGFTTPNTAINLASAISVPARMSIGSMESRMASTPIIPIDLAEKWHRRQRFRSASSL